jgi:GR25 family glycosyltransferase involved in LPS biosynthesis
LWCLTDILKNNFENAIIFEDDVILSKHFVDDFSKIYEKHPKTDLLLLGSHDFNFSRQHFKNVKNALYRPDSDVTKLYGAHANYYSLNGAKRMFYIRATNLSFFDNEYNLIFNSLPNSYICYPNLAIANMTESKLNHEKNILSQNEINYYTECFINLKLNTYNLIYTNLLDLALLKADDTVEEFIERCLFQIFNDDNKIKIIKTRFVFNFFTINDLKNMLSNQDFSVMVPNNLSKKCIGELL